ncbi:MAG TPA: hypothetical protein VIR78_10875 [Malonomonas sp.]
MRTTYDSTLKANVTLDADGRIRDIHHIDAYHEIEQLRGRAAATAYVREMGGTFNIIPQALHSLERQVSYLEPLAQEVEYHFSEEKVSFDSATYGYYQTYLNTPVWAAGVTATLKQAPARVIAATNTSVQGIDAKLPSPEAIERYRQLFASAEKSEAPAVKLSAAKEAASDGPLLSEILGKTAKASKAVNLQQNAVQLIRGRFFIYRYLAAERSDDHSHQKPDREMAKRDVLTNAEYSFEDQSPSLPLPAVPKEIEEGRWYLVAELIVRLPYQGRMMNWRLLVEVESNAILYLRALTANVSGLVFTSDPITASGNAANSPAANNTALNPLRSTVVLPGLTPPAPGINQGLTGTYVRISDFEPATVAPPTVTAGGSFNYAARTNNFAAVNAYYHCDRFFRLVVDLGFSLSSYFGGTSFPVPVDHRGRFGSLDGIERNASCSGDGDGIANVDFELADLTDTANPMGIAADWRVVLHELGGHGILYDHVNTANFGFAHSAGDSFAVILNDPNSQATDRFESFPWVSFIGRRHDRSVAAGWGWGGSNDVGGYSSEQILATTLFRVYRSIGGDSTSLARREFAARAMAYLMLRAVGTLTPTSNPSSPAQFLTALLTADAGNWTSEGVFGGAYGKVFSWSFEKQNLNGGALPSVDVYIEDGRAGEYDYLPVHWATTSIWNRRSADNLPGHQEAALGDTNYAYVKIKNRGTSVANNVIVKGYHCKPSAGVLWPNDLQPFTTAQLSAGTLQPNNAEEKTIGPFAWTPVSNAWGHDCMLLIVSASGDPSNVDKFTAGEVVEDWRLVPNDNNVGQRNVTLVPGGGGVRGLLAGLHGKGFWVGNPGRTTATVAVTVSLPPLLAERGWRISLRDLPENGARLKAQEPRLVTYDLHAGSSFSKADTLAANERDIVITATADGAIIGGMVYRIDPELVVPFNDRTPAEKTDGCRDKASQLLDCLDLPSRKVKCVRVRKVAIDIEMDDDGCGCD